MDGSVFGGLKFNSFNFLKRLLVSVQIAFLQVLFNLLNLFAYFSVTNKHNSRQRQIVIIIYLFIS